MTIDVVMIQPIAALVAGILILLIPRLLNFIVAIVGLWPGLHLHSSPLTRLPNPQCRRCRSVADAHQTPSAAAFGPPE
jgi:hypothetical protein